MAVENQIKQKTGTTTLGLKDLSVLLPAKTSALLAEGTVFKIFPSPKDIPDDNETKAMEVINRPLKVTNTKEDTNVGYTYLKKLEVLKNMLEGTDDFNELRKRVKDQKDKVAEVFRDNMANVFAEQRGLEKTYREIDTFFLRSSA